MPKKANGKKNGYKGRPAKYSKELADKICEGLAYGFNLSEVCRDLPVVPSTVINWANTDREGFFESYARAREIGYQVMADQLIEICDDSRNDWMDKRLRDGTIVSVPDNEAIQRSKLRIEARKWLLAKALPKIYGDHVGAPGTDSQPLKIELVQFKADDTKVLDITPEPAKVLEDKS